MVRDRVGCWYSAGDGMEYLFTPSGMHDASKLTAHLQVLRLNSLLDAPKSGQASNSKRIHRPFVRVYVVRPDLTMKTEAAA